MAVSRTIQHHIAKGDWDAVEDEWLGHLAEYPEDLDTFVGIARALSGQGEDERARFLLELFDEALIDRGLDRIRLRMLERAGHLLLDPEPLHAEIVASLTRIYGDHSAFSGLTEKVGLHRATHDRPKTWEKVARLEQLLRFDVGTVVRMQGHGAGRVTEVNFALDSLKVDFPHHPGLTVGFRAAPKLLEPLPPGHVLRRKIEQPESLVAMVRDDPPGLLRLVLESFDRPLSGAEIREHLAGVVDEAGWAAWWAAARKDPHVVASRGGRQTYAWAESHDHAAEARWQDFERAAPRERIGLLRRDGGRAPELEERMAEVLAEQAETTRDGDPGLAYEIVCALERTGAGPPFAADDLVTGPGRPDRLLAGIEDRALRERAYRAVGEQRDDWREIFLDRLAVEEDPRILDLMAEALAEVGDSGYERFLDGLLTQPHRAPAAFVWLAERAAGDDPLRGRNPLRLLQQILAAPARAELAPYRVRLTRLAESGGTLPRLLAHLTEDQAAAARDAVHRAAALEAYQRDGLEKALELRFPALRGEGGDDEVLYALPPSIAAKREELDRITRVELPANRKAIEEARALGDLRENFEYKSARQRHEYLSARASTLHRDLGRARPLDLAQVDPSEVRIGTRVRLTGGDGGGERRVTILGPWESDPERDVVSYQSELARALLGKKPGDRAQAGGEAVTVTAVERIEG